ncbi:tyrosine-protein phosphatase [Aquibacillus albus]|uniref:Tyrosine-protein phosphatase n=1 Tax=Aquibacillus albus TaxID=1168171 RepID=A0ABS2N5P4_9BACI|nr:CpsB/CapC family capsule biosynthesis tyrosine phosphatase [Aquibacillus albus]MBM7573472.1 protein-tyrosine phosphatase [Aquibacillus albus]
MIDIHCHILPGMDDGPEDYRSSLNMAKAAVDQGIHTIIATPHHRNGSFNNNKESILKKVSQLNEFLYAEQVPITILPGQETRIYGEMTEDILYGSILPLIDISEYVFVELPFGNVPRYTSELFFDLKLHGYTPIIVHPERNRDFLERPEKLYELVKNGALTQITASSLNGRWGKKVKVLSEQFIHANLVHFIASDAHNTTSRPFELSDAYEQIKRYYGNELLFYFMENCELLINGETIHQLEPNPVRKRKILGLF